MWVNLIYEVPLYFEMHEKYKKSPQLEHPNTCKYFSFPSKLEN